MLQSGYYFKKVCNPIGLQIKIITIFTKPLYESYQMKIIIPPDFITACEVLGIQPQATLQLFVDYLSVYIYLPPTCDQPQPVAAAIFKSFIEKSITPPKPDSAKRELQMKRTRKRLRSF